MAKKIVRGITDVKTINNQDFDTNNVNDLLSDGQYNYIHRKKGEKEEYHNLTDNIKTISSDNTELLAVTNNNKTTNTATLHPKHDAQKEQVLESTRNTVTINHGTNGTAEKTTVDTNPQKVLEHEKLKTGDGLTVTHAGTTSTINIKPSPNGNPLNNGFYMGNVIGDNLPSSIISLEIESNKFVQLAFRESGVTPNLMIMRYRFVNEGTPTDWKLAAIDNEQLLSLLARKQDTLVAGTGITIQGNTISASGGATHTFQNFSTSDFVALKQVVTSEHKDLKTFSFECLNQTPEFVLTGELKEELQKFVFPNYSISNGAITITNDGTNMKLINSAPSENVRQHATFTFYTYYGGGGGDVAS